MDGFLFDRGDTDSSTVPATEAAVPSAIGKPRLRVPHRDQVEIHWAALDQLLEPDHRARYVWQMVCGLNLDAWLGEIKAVEGHVGRDATDPRLMVALWVLATLDGEASARKLADLCEHHLAYRWLCGGVSLNHRLLSDFRSQGGGKWNDLLTQIVGSLLNEGLVTLNRVAQDGMRVRASAGKASFRRKSRLEQCLEEAREQVETLACLGEEDAEELSRRQRQARERAARERQQRLEQALKQCDELQAEREASAKQSGRAVREARASTTDPEARTMKFADGGYRPGYNVQFSTDTATGMIVGVKVTNEGTDNEQLPPMLEQVQERYGEVPTEAVVDGGFASKEAIEQGTKLGCVVYAPLKEEEKQISQGKDPYAKKKGDSPAVAEWRTRMGTAAAKAIYKLRCQTAEWVNALCRNRGFWQMPVRGLAKCQTVALLYAITHNPLQAVKLRAQAATASG